MKRSYLWTFIATAAIAAALFAVFHQKQPDDSAVLVENGVSRKITREEAGKLYERYGIPPAEPAHVQPSFNTNSNIRTNLNSIEQVQRINSINNNRRK